MIAIVNGQFPSLVFPYLHATLRRYPGAAGPLQLQQPVLVAHHPVFTHHTFFLQPEDFVQLPRRRASRVIIGLRRRFRITLSVTRSRPMGDYECASTVRSSSPSRISLSKSTRPVPEILKTLCAKLAGVARSPLPT
jgi:hypothetical protein